VHPESRVCSNPRDVRSSLGGYVSAGALERKCTQAQMLCARFQAFKVLSKRHFKPNFQWYSSLYQIKPKTQKQNKNQTNSNTKKLIYVIFFFFFFFFFAGLTCICELRNLNVQHLAFINNIWNQASKVLSLHPPPPPPPKKK
jgi:hypothetical protein